MNQILIVKSSTAINGKTDGAGANVTPYDLSNLAKGAITFFELGGSSPLSTVATKNFGIALGRGANSCAFVIPEVNIDTLTVSKALPKLGTAFKRKFTFPTPVVGKDYTVMFVKKEVVPHERNTWTCSITAGSTTAATEATSLKKAIEAKLGDKFTVTVSTADITIVGKTIGEQWEAKFADALTGTSWAGSTDFVDATHTIGDKKYIQWLASKCAAGKGFTDTYADGDSIYPGYPEEVEDLTPNTSGNAGASTAGYALYTLRFATGRESAKQRDEKVWQIVYIAVPITASAYSTIDAILPEGKYTDAVNDAASATIAASVVTDMVKESALNGD